MSRRRAKPRILRLAATALAATGLLGHGLAMLLAGLLAGPAAAEAPAASFAEICTPDGLVRLTDRMPGKSGGEENRGKPLKGCPVCITFAQTGTASLPEAEELAPPACCSATERPVRGRAAAVTFPQTAQPRAPPAQA